MQKALKKPGLEKELKYFLTEQDYKKLLIGLRSTVSKSVRQTNYYFDDSKLRLRKKKIGLRLRFLNNKKAVVTLKHPAKGSVQNVPSLKVRHEYEEEIPLTLAKAILQGRASLFDLDITPIKIIREFYPERLLKKIQILGSVDTIRTFIYPRKGLELELDSFKMFKSQFYELEVETTSPHKADHAVREILKELEVPYLPITRSKLGRFIDEWKKYHR